MEVCWVVERVETAGEKDKTGMQWDDSGELKNDSGSKSVGKGEGNGNSSRLSDSGMLNVEITSESATTQETTPTVDDSFDSKEYVTDEKGKVKATEHFEDEKPNSREDDTSVLEDYHADATFRVLTRVRGA